MFANPRFRSNTPARNVLVTDSINCFFPARSNFTHSLCYLHPFVWYRLRLSKLMFVEPVGMISDPWSGGVTNVVPGAVVPNTVSNKSPLKYTYVPPPILDGIDA